MTSWAKKFGAFSFQTAALSRIPSLISISLTKIRLLSAFLLSGLLSELLPSFSSFLYYYGLNPASDQSIFCFYRDLKKEIADRVSILPEHFEVFVQGARLEPDDLLLMDRFKRIPKPHAFITMQRHPDFADEEFDNLFKTSQSRRRTPEPTSTTPAPRAYSPAWNIYAPEKKSSTGFAGLSNQGATCYMNSLIQGLYMTPEFRSAVYNWSFIEHLTSRVAKLIANPEARKGSKEEDMTWVEYADELLSLYNALDQDNGASSNGASSDNSISAEATSAPSDSNIQNGSSASQSSNSATIAAYSEENFESKFLKAARAQSMALHAHAVNFEKWKRRVEAKSIPFQLRLLFANLQLSEQRAVSTKGLTKSFGWTGADAFTQHDVQELLRVLFDALETAWDGTPQHSLINDLYQGSVLDYVKCSHCGHKSARRDAYLDLQLTVKPFGEITAVKSVEEALEKYVQPEMLEGDNQYFCNECNCKRDATKGLEFSSFPYLLTLQLKRFDFDWETERRIKLSDKVTFPFVLDLNHFISDSSENHNFMTSSDGNSASNVSSTVSSKLDSFACPQEITIRFANPFDFDQILSLVSASFESDMEKHIVEALQAALPNSHLLSLVAVDKLNRIVGHVMFSPVEINSSLDDETVSFNEPNTPVGKSVLSAEQLARVPSIFGLAPLSVHSSRRREGIAASLVSFGLKVLLSWGVKAVVVLGSPAYYSRFGFVPASQFGLTYDNEETDHFMVMELAQGSLARASLPRPGGCNVTYCDAFRQSIEYWDYKQSKTTGDSDIVDEEIHGKDAVPLQNGKPVSWEHVLSLAANHRASFKIDDEDAFAKLPTSSPLEKALEGGPNVYELFAIFVHRGSAIGGHYFAYVKDFDKDTWFEFNDSMVSQISEETVRSSYGGDVGYGAASGSSAYMLLYRQYDSTRNAKYPNVSSIPKETVEAMDKEKKRREAKEALKRIEAQKVSITVSYRGTRKDIRLHRDQPILEALKMAIEVFQVTASIENVRFHTTSQFTRPEDPSLFDLANKISDFSRDAIAQVQLQVRKPGQEFAVFDPKKVLFLVNVWDSETSSWPAESYEVYLPPKPELGQLKDYVATHFGIPQHLQIITKEKNSAQPIEEITGDDSRSLGSFFLWESAKLWVEPYSDSLIDQNYRPIIRKRVVSSLSTKYSSTYSYSTSSSTYSTSSSSSNSSTLPSASKSSVDVHSSGEEMTIVPIGFEDDEPEPTAPIAPESPVPSTDSEKSSQNEESAGKDDSYEFFDPKFIYRNGRRIIPRAEDFVRNAQNRIIIRFTTVNGSEMVNSITFSKSDSVGSLRDKIAAVLKVDPMSFVILKCLSDTELNDSEASIDSFTYGSIVSFNIRSGTPSLRGESLIKLESYVLEGPTGSTRRPLFEPRDWFVAADRLSVKDAKPLLRRLVGLDPATPLECIRLRKPGPPSSFEGLAANIGPDSQRISLFGNRLLVQVLDQPEPKQNEHSKVLVLRQVHPETWELGPAIEHCVPAGGTFGEVRAHCAKISGLESVQCVNRAIYHLPQLNELEGLDWVGYESRLERAVGATMSDGDHIFFKDANIPFRKLTEEEKRKLPKAKSSSSSNSWIRRTAERALTIKVDDSA